jgi:hypothetical protein
MVAFLLTAVAGEVSAQTPVGTTFTYQGQLKDGGLPAFGAYDFLFYLYDSLGNLVGGPLAADDWPVEQGLFTVQLDFGNVYDAQQHWLEIAVRPGAGGGYTTLAPRQLLSATPYAVYALSVGNADTLDGQHGSFYQNASNLNAGTLPSARLSGTYSNALTLSNAANAFTGSGAGLTALNASNVTSGTLANARTTGTALNTPSTLVLRDASGNFAAGTITGAFSGGGAGLTTLNASNVSSGTLDTARLPVPLTLSGTSAGHIIRGDNASTADLSAGVVGRSIAGSGTTFGVYGQSSSTSGRGVDGWANAATGTTYGVYGHSESTSGRGVFGSANAASGGTYGVYGQSNSTTGVGVYGHAYATTGLTWGLFGQSNSTSGLGVHGQATATSGTIYGVYGYANTAAGGYAVYAQGDMGASGTKPFRIDHPDDPENKYLLHYAAESPEVINFYSGKATLDGAGQAVVELPHYFAKINKDPRYTLTAVGAPMPRLHVAVEIDEAALSAGAKAGPGEAAPVCTFRIAGGAPGAKVSWRVEALRNDLWVQKRGAPVEVEKQDLEKGTYQHPELYGQPPEKGMNYEAERERPSPAASPEATPEHEPDLLPDPRPQE